MFHYQQKQNEFNNLEHVRWLAEHIDEYEFLGHTDNLQVRVTETAVKRNTYYGECEEAYEAFCQQFDNNPSNYRLGVFDGEDDDIIRTDRLDHYLIKWNNGSKSISIPAAYMIENHPEKAEEIRGLLRELISTGYNICQQRINAIEQKLNDCQSILNGYADDMKRMKGFCRKQVRWERIMLFLAWMLLILVVRVHPLIGRRIGYHPGILGSELPHPAFFANLGNPWQWITFAALMLLGGVIAWCSVWLVRKDVIVRNMDKIVEHYDNLNKHRQTVADARGLLAVGRDEERIVRDCRTKQLKKVVEDSRRVLVFTYPRKLSPAEYLYCFGGLKKIILWACALCFVLLILYY